jgi:hypothetical protein
VEFYLGTHMPSWLTKVDVPLCISHRSLVGRKTMPRARGPWILDSGGFTELQMFGEWRTTPAEYVAWVRRYQEEIGNLVWAAPQDWMCEPVIINGGRVGAITFAGTHLSVEEHQWRTVLNFIELRELAPDLPFIPVLQGFTRGAYERCAEMYAAGGVDLAAEPTVGIGSVCRRQATAEIAEVIGAMADRGIRLHGFGVKSQGLTSVAPDLSSADSLAWSMRGRHEPGCTGTHKTESNCLAFALAWRQRAIAAANSPAAPRQMFLPVAA